MPLEIGDQAPEFTLKDQHNQKVAQDYGVYNDKAGTANRGTFLVDTDGVIRFAEVKGPGETRHRPHGSRPWPRCQPR